MNCFGIGKQSSISSGSKMRFLVVFAVFASCTTASLFGGRNFGVRDNGNLIMRTDIGKHILISKPAEMLPNLQDSNPWTERLPLERSNPNMYEMGMEDSAEMEPMSRKKTLRMLSNSNPWNTPEFERTTPTMYEMEEAPEIEQIPRWKTTKMLPNFGIFNPWIDRFPLQHTTPPMYEVGMEYSPEMEAMPRWTMTRKIPRMNMMIHKTQTMPYMDNIDGMGRMPWEMNTLRMNQKYLMPMMYKRIFPMTYDRMAPMIRMTPSNMYPASRLVETDEDWPLEDSEIYNDISTRNDYWNMYWNRMNPIKARRMKKDYLPY